MKSKRGHRNDGRGPRVIYKQTPRIKTLSLENCFRDSNGFIAQPVETEAQIGWSNSAKYEDKGWNPAVATNHDGTMVEVHNGTNGVGPLWYRDRQITTARPQESPSTARQRSRFTMAARV